MNLIRFAAALLALALAASAYGGVYEDLIIAAKNDNNEKVISLIQRGADVNTADQNGTTLAMFAARAGNEKLLEFLLSNHANILIKSAYGDTAISLAALEGHLNSVKILAKAGAPIDLEPGSWSPLNYAAFSGYDEVAAYLIGQGAKVDIRASNSMTSLMLAARNGHLGVAKLLLANGANTSLTTTDGKTALDIAHEGNQNLVAELIVAAKSADKR